jgi:hypothetical protein
MIIHSTSFSNSRLFDPVHDFYHSTNSSNSILFHPVHDFYHTTYVVVYDSIQYKSVVVTTTYTEKSMLGNCQIPSNIVCAIKILYKCTLT